MHHYKKFYLALALMAVAAGAMLYFQIKRTANIDIRPATLPLVDQNFTEIPLTVADKPLGNPGAQLLIVGFFDFNEEIDREQVDLIADFVQDNPKAVQFYAKNGLREKFFATGDRTLPHRALICAGNQKKYLEFLNELAFVEKTKIETLTKIATDIKLNSDAWQNCLNSDATKQIVEADLALSQNLGLKTTPVIFANNKKLNLDEDVDLKDLLNKLIAL